jgi:carbamoyl-phosphate synthase small subunit
LSGNALLALEDGSLFYGTSIGIDGEAIGEVVFNTAITGYQEIITDPSYSKQIVTLTHPHIGNVGTNPEDEESNNVFISGLVIRDLPLVVSNWRATESLSDYLKRNNVVGISGIDTRQLTRHLRKNGAMKACVVAGSNIDADKAVETAKSFAGLVGMDLAKEVSTKESYTWNESTWDLEEGAKAITGKKDFRVIAYDFGVKRNILRLLVDQGCDVKVVPAQTPAKDVLAEQPDGIFLSNGPGDPEPCDYAITAIKEIIETGIPVFGICLGHQLLSLALGAKTIKMKFGHHGANHPVQALDSKQVFITSQNHGFAVDEESLPDCLTTTHRSLFDGSLQGVHHKERPVFGFQGHPEASPGPHDIQLLFNHFTELMKEHKS